MENKKLNPIVEKALDILESIGIKVRGGNTLIGKDLKVESTDPKDASGNLLVGEGHQINVSVQPGQRVVVSGNKIYGKKNKITYTG